MKYLASPFWYLKFREKDTTGNGWFGAKRGDNLHEGVDVVGVPGEEVFACMSGKVRLGKVYKHDRDGKEVMQLVEIESANGKVKQMYVDPRIKDGEFVEMNQKIGILQDVAEYWDNELMKPHCHVEFYKFGMLVDPEPFLILGQAIADKLIDLKKYY